MSSPTPVVFIHGLWIHSTAWQPWQDLFRAEGYEPSAPGWPGDLPTVEGTRKNVATLAGVGIDDIAAAYRQYHDRGLEIVGVSLDHDRDAFLGFTKKHAMPWPQQFDGQGWNNPYAVKYGVRGIPEMWLVGRDGKVTATGLHGSQLTAKLDLLLPP